MRSSEKEPDVAPVSLPLLSRFHDPASDPPAPYFDAGIATENPDEVVIAFSRAALRRHKRAALYLGQLFETGDGVPLAPDVASQWYAVHNDANYLAERSLGHELREGGTALPLFSTIAGTRAEFVWVGKAQMFQLEIGDAEQIPIGRYNTPLTAAMINVPSFATFWRIRTGPQETTAWIPIASAEGPIKN